MVLDRKMRRPEKTSTLSVGKRARRSSKLDDHDGKRKERAPNKDRESSASSCVRERTGWSKKEGGKKIGGPAGGKR